MGDVDRQGVGDPVASIQPGQPVAYGAGPGRGALQGDGVDVVEGQAGVGSGVDGPPPAAVAGHAAAQAGQPDLAAPGHGQVPGALAAGRGQLGEGAIAGTQAAVEGGDELVPTPVQGQADHVFANQAVRCGVVRLVAELNVPAVEAAPIAPGPQSIPLQQQALGRVLHLPDDPFATGCLQWRLGAGAGGDQRRGSQQQGRPQQGDQGQAEQIE
jgi:hypothetical protein